MSVALAIALSGLAGAQTQATPVDGETLLSNCLAEPVCENAVLRLLSENMVEYGLVMQADPIALSALGGKGRGPVAEVRFDTVTFGHKNEIEKQVTIPPLLPRIGLGYQFGSQTYLEPGPQTAVGATVLPPFKLLGGLMAGVQLDGSVAVPVVKHLVWVGAELGYGFTHLAIPLLGTDEQLSDIENLSPWLPDAQYVPCPAVEKGCLDSFGQHAGAVRLGFSLEPAPPVFTYTRIAGIAVRQRLTVAYDTSVWTMGTLQLQGHAGVGVRAGDFYQLSLGTVVSSRPELASTDRTRAMVKAVAASSWRFGGARTREAEVSPSGP